MNTRIERDSMGAIDVPADRLWGAQTQRSLVHFGISSERMPPELIKALARVKRACAVVNARLSGLSPQVADAIVSAADEVIEGRHGDEFPLRVWQTGSGTQTHMNLNEVLANRASQRLGGQVGVDRLVHPNDDVNRSQSSNDVFPTAMHLATIESLVQGLLPALNALRQTLSAKAQAFDGIVKVGRTHLQDATPITLGQEISGWAMQLAQAERHILQTLPHLHELAIGGTAVGTGLNAPLGFGEAVAAELAQDLGWPLLSAPNKFEALAASDALVHAHGALKGLAVSLMKIANDVRWLASGPRSGLGELSIPDNEPGSSIMPGKVNPTQCEALTMVCAQVMGNDVAVGIGGASGQFELNVFRPLMAHNVLQSLRLLTGAMAGFDRYCAQGIQSRDDRIAGHLAHSLMLVTALVPHIGHDCAAAIAKKALDDGTGLREAALASGAVTADDYDRWVVPARMAGR
jgi:fumarate hydratase, class II